MPRAEPEAVSRAQAALGREAAGAMIEDAIAAIATGPGRRAACAASWWRVARPPAPSSRRSASTALEIGPQIAPGVPATLSYGEPRLALALKSGNFGGPDFFTEALEALQ